MGLASAAIPVYAGCVPVSSYGKKTEADTCSVIPADESYMVNCTGCCISPFQDLPRFEGRGL